MSADDRDTLQRFVAGLDVGPDALAAAITRQAFDETIVDEALLLQLASEEVVVRRRTTRRIAGMPVLSPAVAARLRQIAADDDDGRTRAAAQAALDAHAPEPPAAPPRRRRRALLEILVAQPRGDSIVFGPAAYSDAPLFGGDLREVGGVVRFALVGLPEAFVGTRPSVVHLDGELARATEPVTAAGAVTIAFPAKAGDFETLSAQLRSCELVVFED